MRRHHEGKEGYEDGNHSHENEGTPQLLAAEVSMGKLTSHSKSDRQPGSQTEIDKRGCQT